MAVAEGGRSAAGSMRMMWVVRMVWMMKVEGIHYTGISEEEAAIIQLAQFGLFSICRAYKAKAREPEEAARRPH